jgi:hypothetical protein
LAGKKGNIFRASRVLKHDAAKHRPKWERSLTDNAKTAGTAARALKMPSPKHGAGAALFCEICGTRMRISRREQHPNRGPKHELQTFTCPRCMNTQQREASSPGAEGQAPS